MEPNTTDSLTKTMVPH